MALSLQTLSPLYRCNAVTAFSGRLSKLCMVNLPQWPASGQYLIGSLSWPCSSYGLTELMAPCMHSPGLQALSGHASLSCMTHTVSSGIAGNCRRIRPPDSDQRLFSPVDPDEVMSFLLMALSRYMALTERHQLLAK